MHGIKLIHVSKGGPGRVSSEKAREVREVEETSAPTARTWALAQYSDCLSRYGIPVVKVRGSRDRFICNMGMGPYTVKTTTLY